MVEAISKNTVHLRDLLESLDEKDRNKALNFYPDLGGAPHIVVVVIPRIEDSWDRKWCIAAATSELIVIFYAALELGLATCGVTCAPWVEEEIKRILNIPEDKEILCCFTLGYSDESPKPPSHKKVPIHYVD